MARTVVKTAGRVYTPEYLVNNVLDLCGYTASVHILQKHVLDNSCGDGAFLSEVVRRYIVAYRKANQSDAGLKQALETYIHGIELSAEEAEKCRQNLTEVAGSFGIYDVVWDVECADALRHTRHLEKMDFVVGNPPYVRVHNLGDAEFLKHNYSFARGGMTDLYIAFYELGFHMLNDTGVLGYVSPSSFFNSRAGSAMRDYILYSRCMKAIVDLGHFQPFGATTYVVLAICTKRENDSVEYYTYDAESRQPIKQRSFRYGEFSSDDDTFLFDNDDMVYRVLASEGVRKRCIVKNGFTTLLDEFFISDGFSFAEYVIPVLKASTGSQERCIFPYDKSGRPIPFKSLCDVLELQKRYEAYKEKLLRRDLGLNTRWYEFGRAQGIKDVYVHKYAINTLIRDERDVKLVACPPGTGVYSGLYILTEVPEARLRNILCSKDFGVFVKSLGKYKSGGYYTYSSKELQLYLNYKLSEAEFLD